MLRKAVRILILVLVLCLALGTGLFLFNASSRYDLIDGFASVPLDFDPETGTSTYQWNTIQVTVTGGFIKGIRSGRRKPDSLVVRALSPFPAIRIVASGTPVTGVSVILENISPERYAESLGSGTASVRTSLNALTFSFDLAAGETHSFVPLEPADADSAQVAILGDSRDGYDTFGQMIQQIDRIDPAFVIDNGDLVYSGKPNQYRLFNHLASGLSTTLCTTLGNHDIRKGGRADYTQLYGPAYYSFDYGSSHYAFLDSSPGWTQKKAVTEEQYAWLEKDLAKAQGKTIIVVSHIPPTDPRNNKQPNPMVAYIDGLGNQVGLIEKFLDSYVDKVTVDHGFQDPQEALRFQKIMSDHGVEKVYLSHIHSFFDYTIDGVRYIITGGAGAELLTTESYYHYILTSNKASDAMTLVQLPSPANNMLTRFVTAATLFAVAIYRENPVPVVLILSGLALLAVLIILQLSIRHQPRLKRIWLLVHDTGRFFMQRRREIYKKKENE